jgi:hypothetical protein
MDIAHDCSIQPRNIAFSFIGAALWHHWPEKLRNISRGPGKTLPMSYFLENQHYGLLRRLFLLSSRLRRIRLVKAAIDDGGCEWGVCVSREGDMTVVARGSEFPGGDKLRLERIGPLDEHNMVMSLKQEKMYQVVVVRLMLVMAVTYGREEEILKG